MQMQNGVVNCFSRMITRKIGLCSVSLLLALACACGTSHAAIIEYTSQSAFSSAIGGVPQTTLTFEGIASAGTQVNENGSYADSGVVFTGSLAPSGGGASTPDVVIAASDYTSGFYSLGTGADLLSGFGGLNSGVGYDGIFNAQLPAGMKAVGFNIGSEIVSAPEVFRLLVSYGNTSSNYVFTSTPSTASYLGFVADAPISSIQITNTFADNPTSSSPVEIDNFSYTPVPEPAALSLMVIASAGLLVRRRRCV